MKKCSAIRYYKIYDIASVFFTSWRFASLVTGGGVTGDVTCDEPTSPVTNDLMGLASDGLGHRFGESRDVRGGILRVDDAVRHREAPIDR